MKILHILDHSIPLHSGYTFRTLSILREQARMGLDTVQITSAKHHAKGPEVEEIDGLRFYRTKQTNGFVSRLPLLNQQEIITSLSRRLNQVIAREQPDLIHAHSPALNGIAALRAAGKYSLPMVYECRAFWEDAAVDHGTITAWGIRYRLTRWLETRVFRKADAIVAICEGLRSDIAERGISADTITVVPNGVNPDDFSRTDGFDRKLAKQLGLHNHKVIGFLGSFYHYEGLHLLIQAMPDIVDRIPGAKLLLVGGGPMEQTLKKQAEHSPVAGSIIFTGRVPHSEVGRYYDLVDVLAFPRISIRLTELVTPLKPLEAMAQGKLVVASDVGGHRELIWHEKNGYLFPAGSVEQLAETLVAAIENRRQAERIIEYARNFIATRRSWQKSVANYLPVYKSLVR